MIKDALKAEQDNILHANLFNSTILPPVLYISKTWATVKKEEQTANFIDMINLKPVITKSSTSSSRAASTDIPDPLSPFLSFIAFGRSSGLHPVSSHNCYMYVRAGRPAFAWPYAGVHRSTSLMSSSLLLQQCPACLVRLTCIVFVMGGNRSYSWCLVGC